MELLKKRLANLLTIKSLVTLTAAAVFGVLALRGDLSGDQFLTVFSVIVAFYFGTQSQKKEDGV
jgi:threonine/homoserine efflux transporter RhtA